MAIRSRGTLLAVGAGACAATASACGKLGVDDLFEASVTVQAIVRVGCLVAMLVWNGLMVNLYTKSLLHSDATSATATNTASNFCVTAMWGFLLFHEALPPLWWMGAALVLGGMLLVHMGSSNPLS